MAVQLLTMLEGQPDDICVAMWYISTKGLDLQGAGSLQGVLEVDVLGHLDLLIKQGRLTVLGQAAA